MTITDYIDIGGVVVFTVTLVVFLWQVIIENRLSKAEMLKGRFEMYWQAYEATSQEEMEELVRYPQDYIDMDKYERKYKNDPQAIRKYIRMSKLYEYLAFTNGLRKLGLPDPLNLNTADRMWTTDLAKEEAFRDVHDYYRGYYPYFEEEVDRILKETREEEASKDSGKHERPH